MDRFELEAALEAEAIHPRAYNLDGALRDDALSLEETERGWSVFYSERNQRGVQWDFDTEDAACRYLLHELLRDDFNRFQLVAGPSTANTGEQLLAHWLLENRLRPGQLGAGDTKIDRILCTEQALASRLFIRRTLLRELGLPLA